MQNKKNLYIQIQMYTKILEYQIYKNIKFLKNIFKLYNYKII